MFQLQGNQTIKIDKGDDSARFPLFINKGSSTVPIRYKFSKDHEINIYSNTIKAIDIDKFAWNDKVDGMSGLYPFIYHNDNWYLYEDKINISDYGLKIFGEVSEFDRFTVTYVTKLAKVNFYILEINSEIEDYLVKKVFRQDGSIVTYYNDERDNKRGYDEHIINKQGDFILHIDSEDTKYLDREEYEYLIQVELLDPDTRKMVVNTITHRYPFIVL